MTPTIITPEFVLGLKKPTADFLCSDAGYRFFVFVEFTIKTLEDNKTIFSVKRPEEYPILWEDNDPSETEGREIAYEFPTSFLDSKQIGTSLTFAVGPKELKNFRMIERHYFKDKLIRSYDFTFGFCIPNTVNNWETVYEVPQLDKKTRQDILDCPGQSTSDSFYFIDGKLVLHNKANYSYTD